VAESEDTFSCVSPSPLSLREDCGQRFAAPSFLSPPFSSWQVVDGDEAACKGSEFGPSRPQRAGLPSPLSLLLCLSLRRRAECKTESQGIAFYTLFLFSFLPAGQKGKRSRRERAPSGTAIVSPLPHFSPSNCHGDGVRSGDRPAPSLAFSSPPPPPAVSVCSANSKEIGR